MSYKFIDTFDEVTELCHVVENYKGVIGADTETTGLDWMLDKILLLQLNVGGQVYVIDVRKAGIDSLSNIIAYLQMSGNTVIFHNAKFDMKFIFYATKLLLNNVYDTMVAEAILVNGKGNIYPSLVDLVNKYTNYSMEKESRSEFINFPDEKPFTEGMISYSALDVLVLPEIYTNQMSEIISTHQDKVVKLECDLLPVVTKMEIDGIRLDTEAWLSVEAKAVNRRNTLYEELKQKIVDFAVQLEVANGLELADRLCIPVKGKARRKSLEDITDISIMDGWLKANFNPKSSKQMLTILTLMGLKIVDTNEKTLTPLKGKNAIIDTLLSIREVNKQIDSYGKNVIELIHPVTGKIHTEYSTIGTATGRFSSRNPNMQQVPTHGGYRECFIPDEGFVFVSIDYSQQEYRLAGAVSREPIIIEAYKNGSDMHTATAANFYSKAMSEVTKDERSWGKTRNFEIIYGTTEWGLSKSLKTTLEEAKSVLDKYWAGYPTLYAFKMAVEARIMELGFSSTPLGRRRYNVPRPVFMNSGEFQRWVARVKREGFNHIIQGGGADIIKLAMIEIFNSNPYGNKLRLCLQIHDELVCQIHESIKEEGALFVRDIMEKVEQRFLGEIPAKADGWDEFKTQWSK